MLVAPKDTNGFIRGLSKDIVEKLEHKDNRVRIAGHWYIHRDEPDTYLCEMHPTIRNFIIVLDQLFDLKMFTDTPLPIAFMSDRFNATFFPLLCKHVELLHNTVLNDTILTSLDQDEHTEHGVRIACPTFDLILTDEHAEIITHTKGNTIADLAPHIIHRILHTPDSQKRWQYAQLLSVFPFEPQQLPADKPGAYLLYLPLYDIQTKIKAALFCIQKLSEQTASEADRTYYTDKAINFIRQLPERLDWHYHEQLIRTMDGRVLAYAPIAAEIERIMATAQARMTGDSAACEYVPNLYIALINKGQKRTDVLPIVNNIIARTDSFDRRPLLNLLILLAQQGQAVQQSRKAVEICINNSIEAERMLAQTLNEILLKQ